MQEVVKVYIVGIGDDGKRSLSASVLDIVERAEILFGGERHLSFFPYVSAQKVTIKSNLPDVVKTISKNLGKKQMVVLASGDPLFYGIAKYLMSKIPKEHFEAIPNVSSMQIAFARAKESWDDAVLTSIHAKPIENLLDVVEKAKKIGVFTDDKNTPSRIADFLLKNFGSAFKAYVCENLCGEDERVTESDLGDLVNMEFSPLNVLILVKKDEQVELEPARSWTIGVPDEEFFQRTPQKGLITKQEVRVISLSKMNIKSRSVIWDIGAGSGSVSIESALLAKSGLVYAIEKNEEDIENVKKNIQKFRVKNVEVIHGLAPDCLDGIKERPDSVFIGGSSGNMKEIIAKCAAVLKPEGKIVINAATIENLHESTSGLKECNLRYDVTLISAARSKELIGLTRFDALNPVFVINGERK
jgi:precorrin-6B C5,15-methyltransferase / cobalt-precorrin-6B C5,C15-methyltransferase